MKKIIFNTAIIVALTSVFSLVVWGQTGMSTLRRNPKLPTCNELTWDDLLLRNRKCVVPETGVQTTAGKYRSQVQSGNPASIGKARPKLPNCNELSGEDLLFKNKKCLAPENEVETTVGKYQAQKERQMRNRNRFNQSETLSKSPKRKGN